MTTNKRAKSSKTTRQLHQKKPVFQGKSLRGQPEMYDELKKPTAVSLTPTAIRGLDEIAAAMGISRSELIERIGRGLLQVSICQLLTHTQEVSL